MVNPTRSENEAVGPKFVVLPEPLLRTWIASAEADGLRWGSVFGKWVDARDSLRLVAGPDGERVGVWVTRAQWTRQPAAVRRRLGRRALVVVCGPDTNDRPDGYTWQDNGWRPVPIDVVRLVADYALRQQGLFDVGYLRDKLVTIVGLGTGGSHVATDLARAGVGSFRLVDFDRLEVHNIARHVCTLDDLGRLKTVAVADLLARISPFVQTQTFDCNVLEDPAGLTAAVDGADVVVAATDSEGSKLLINQVCWPRNIPVIYGAAYNRALGGDVFRAIPPDGACYACFQDHVSELFETAPKASEVDYATIDDPTRFLAEPGLGLDVAFIALIHAKLALLTLLHGTPSQLDDLPSNYVMWGNQAAWIFDHPLQAMFVDVPARPGCPVSDRAAFLSTALGETLSRDEVDRRAAELLASASSSPSATS